MIVEFSVKNFRSIKDIQTISFAATGLKSSEEYSEIDTSNIAISAETRLFKTIGIYGANASGKSNIIKALDCFIKVISKEPSSTSNLSELCEPFYYQDNSEETESFFQIVLIVNNEKYRYGLTVKKNTAERPFDIGSKYSDEIITGEWLFGPKEKGKNSVALFTRKGTEINNSLPNKQAVPEIPYEHSLFISHVAAFDKSSICATIKYYLRFRISSIDNTHDRFRHLSVSCIKNSSSKDKEENKEQLLKLLSAFNLKYNDVVIQEDEDTHRIGGIFPRDKISFFREYRTLNNKNLTVQLNLEKNESAGTQKLFDLAGMLLRAFRLTVPVLIILDEIDSNFHPHLLIQLIKLFNDPSVNRSNSQLLFTSHDTNLMSPAIMRRDQFYFTEKNEDESTRLYSLADLKGIRNDADFAKQYLAGYYGAVPILEKYKKEESEHHG